MSKSKSKYPNRIVKTEDVNPLDVIANNNNWREHPAYQRASLDGVLSSIGWVQNIIINQRTGNLIDGHLRLSLALEHNETSIPALFVDLSENEENLILATLDPIAALAETNKESLSALLEQVSTDNSNLQDLLSKIAENNNVIPPDVSFKEYDESIADEVEFLECPSCGHKWPK